MLKTFRRGGVHPPDNKLSAGKPTAALSPPGQVFLSLSQHIGAPAKPVVAPGDRVKVGTLVARADGFISAHVHSSVSGTVVAIDEVIDQSGHKKKAVVIRSEGDAWEESIDRSESLEKNCELSQKEILDRIKEAGIVGLGGAAFPTHVKLVPPPGSRLELLIINGAECEPYLTADHALMMEKGEEIMVGIRLLMRASGVSKAYIGIEDNKKDAIRRLSKLAGDYPGITVYSLKTKYPQGSEKQLVDALAGRKIPGGALPASVGVVVQNVATAFAVYEAVQKNKPLIERVVTVTGKKLASPSNLWVRIGTPVQALIDRAGGLPIDTGKVIAGGPMMGKALQYTDTPVCKGISGVLLLPAAESQRREMRDCIRCSQCIFVCPVHLEPYLLMALAEHSEWDKAAGRHITDCIECGSCSYVCPSDRPLLDYVRMGKAEVIKNQSQRKHE